MTAQPPGEFHIFHQRDGRKTTERGERFPPNEYRLVSKKRAAVPGEKTAESFEPKEPRVPAVKLPVKSSADHKRIPQGSRECLEMRLGEAGVGVMKNKHLAGRALRALVHLRAAIWRRRWQINRTLFPHKFFREEIMGSIDHEDFVQSR
jgi:hypothetical protein